MSLHRVLISVLLLATGAVAACVGDEPETSSVTDAGSGGDATTDGGNTGDASTGDGSTGDAGADAGLITPAALGARLSFWYRGSSLTGDAGSSVTLWQDESTYANSASTGGAPFPPSVGAGPNGTKALTFVPNGGGSSEITIPASPHLNWGTGDFLVFIVARYSNQLDAGNVNCGAAFFTCTTNGKGIGLFGNTGVPGTVLPDTSGIEGVIFPDGPQETTAGSAENDNAFRIYGFRRRGTTLEVYAGSSHTPTSTGSSNVDVSADASLSYYIGEGASWQLNGAIAEMIGAGDGTSTISDAERNGLIDYLARTYGL